MDKAEVKNFLRDIGGMYPAFKAEVSDLALTAWEMTLRAMAYRDAKAALVQYYRDGGKYSPKPKDIARYANPDDGAVLDDPDYGYDGCSYCDHGYVFYTRVHPELDSKPYEYFKACVCHVKAKTARAVEMGRMTQDEATARVISRERFFQKLYDQGILQFRYGEVTQ